MILCAAAWEFMREHKDVVKFDLCTILPSWSMGVSVSFKRSTIIAD